MLWLLYTVCYTAVYGTGCEAFCDFIFSADEIQGKTLLQYNFEVAQNQSMKTVAIEFAKDLQNLHPLSKLKGINVNKECRS